MTAWRRQEKQVEDILEIQLHTVNEEAGHIVFHTEHVEHDMNDDTGERTKECEWRTDRYRDRK